MINEYNFKDKSNYGMFLSPIWILNEDPFLISYLPKIGSKDGSNSYPTLSNNTQFPN